MATGDVRARRVAAGTDRPLHRSVVDLHHPPYWHYDVLQALVVLDRAGSHRDPRTRRAREVVAGKQRRDGGWRAVRPWWRPPGSSGLLEAVHWGAAAHQMVTLNALRVLNRRDGGRSPAPTPPSPAPPAGPPRR
jgi:hypothetical protein